VSPRDRDEFDKRLRVRAPGDIWSDEFREEVRRDMRFEGSLLRREAAVLLLIAAIIALRLLVT
jgi:hypothetical protein